MISQVTQNFCLFGTFLKKTYKHFNFIKVFFCDLFTYCIQNFLELLSHTHTVYITRLQNGILGWAAINKILLINYKIL